MFIMLSLIHISEKMMDGDYYLLTLAAIGRELRIRHVTSARVHIAAGPVSYTHLDVYKRQAIYGVGGC